MTGAGGVSHTVQQGSDARLRAASIVYVEVDQLYYFYDGSGHQVQRLLLR